MRSVLAAGLPLFLVTSLSCISVPDRPGTDKGGDDTSEGDSGPGDTDIDTGTEPSTDSCTADFTMSFPDGSSTTLDFCQLYELDAAFEFDPDGPPEIRSPTLTFHAVTDASFECWVEIIEPAICGEGYYRIDGSSGSVTFDTHDCSGVGDDYESQFVASTGYIQMETLYAGDEAGNFSGQPLATTMAGSLSVSTDDGIVLSGSFSITRDVVADDAEEAGCAVSDGDDDDDGQNDAIFAGDDCNDADPTVYSGAPDLCDGQVNDCGATLPADETDDDADGFVECTADLATWGGDAITGGDDCNDADDTAYPGASELCDGQDNACVGALGSDETDDDADGFVECTIDTGGWDGASMSGGDDCNDAEATIYPGASEICDGQDNDCDSSVPTDESDADSDGYVVCAIDSGGWDATAVSGGEDCAPSDSTVYPGAPELCDGQDNDCDSSVPTDESDADSDGYVACAIDSGGWDGAAMSGGGDCDDAAADVNSGASEVCDGVDNDCDGSADQGLTAPSANLVDGVCSGSVQVCAGTSGWQEPDYASMITDYEAANEVSCDGLDNDCDGVVDEDVTQEWYEDSDGDGYGDMFQSPLPFCGTPTGYALDFSDCNDSDSTVNAGASELCDGQDNDCDAAVPTDESDDDSDGFVECTVDSGGWDGASISGGDDCDDAEATIYPSAAELCDGQDNDCSATLPADETDVDSDGYVECTIDSGGWDGTAIYGGDDCNDSDGAFNPDASEICDGLDNDCDGSLPADEADADSDGVSECEGDCDDSDASVAQTCVPTDSGSSAPGISLNPDGIDTITLAGCGDFADITVDVDITVTNSENLDIYLSSPNGGEAALWFGPAQSDGSANLQVTFGTSDPSHIAPMDPGNLGIFGTAGQWELFVLDFGAFFGQPGTLNSWAINVTCN